MKLQRGRASLLRVGLDASDEMWIRRADLANQCPQGGTKPGHATLNEAQFLERTGLS